MILIYINAPLSPLQPLLKLTILSSTVIFLCTLEIYIFSSSSFLPFLLYISKLISFTKTLLFSIIFLLDYSPTLVMYFYLFLVNLSTIFQVQYLCYVHKNYLPAEKLPFHFSTKTSLKLLFSLSILFSY